MRRQSMYAMAALVAVVTAAPACATKKFVRTEVGAVNDKATSLGGALEETQERTRQNEAKISTVDNKAEAAGRSAAAAMTAADAAAVAVKDTDTRLTARADAIEATAGRLIYEVTLSEDQGNFVFGGNALPVEAKARLDRMVGDLQADPRAVFIEVEGHTDNVGLVTYNERLGLDRAETVKRYLYDQHHVPLHKINVVSYGEGKPVAPNNTRAGRAQNRRVVVRILS